MTFVRNNHAKMRN